MPQLDRLLAVMAGNKTGCLTLEEGNPAEYFATGTDDPRPVTRTPLTGPQIVSLLREIAPPESVNHLEAGKPAFFTYVCVEGAFAARASVRDARTCSA